MSKLALYTVSLRQFDRDEVLKKHLNQKKMVPIGVKSAFLTTDTDLSCRFELDGIIHTKEDGKLVEDRNQWSICSDSVSKAVIRYREIADYLFVFASGDRKLAELTLASVTESQTEEFNAEHPESSLATKYGFPPSSAYCFEQSEDCSLPTLLRGHLSRKRPELFTVASRRFLAEPHVLTRLFEKNIALRSEDQIDAITAIRIIANHLREYLKPMIRKIRKNHQDAWENVLGERIAFIDGGVSRIDAMPSVEPVGIRAGVYSVIPGENDLTEREDWKLYSGVVGDILNDRTYFETAETISDPKRVQEAARYIIESLSALRYLHESETDLTYLFLHGPVQNPFQVYDEMSPNFVPAVDPEFLQRYGVTKEDVLESVKELPQHREKPKWNVPIPVYLHAMKRFEAGNVPIVGVVERAQSRSFVYAVLKWLHSQRSMDSGSKEAFKMRLEKYDIDDEFLFGCVLEEGEYLVPVSMKKNRRHRANERWAPIVDQFPDVHCTMLKASSYSFPFRVEFARDWGDRVAKIMGLLYHTAALLPRYAFPVGIDIADKYAKIPYWLSKGISMQVATAVMLKAVENGDAKIFQQVRQRMSMTPRDFFYRPGIRP